MAETPKLGLTLLEASQAQKHVTVNEGFAVLDGWVQPVVINATTTSPPGSPSEGDCYIVAATASGSWAGLETTLAMYSGGAWLHLVPQDGFSVYDLATSRQKRFDGAAWVDDADASASYAIVGVNTSADSYNRLAVRAPGTLFTSEGGGAGGSHRITVNKSTGPDTASLVFQTGFSGRAEMGLAGSSDFSLKVSPDGSTWLDGVVIDDATGRVTMPGGFSTGGLLGGHAMVICGERNGTLAAGQFMALGNGASVGAGAVMPRAGKVVALGVTIFIGTAGNNVFSVAVNKVANTSYQVALNYPGSGSKNAYADFSSSPLSFAAGDALNVMISTGVSGGAQSSLFIVFD